MAYGFDIKSVIKTNLEKILKFAILLIYYINPKSLYDCLVKLRTILKKQFIVNIINLYQLYKQ